MEGAGMVLITVLVLLVGLAFAWPWFPPPPPGGAMLSKYWPVRNGEAWLDAEYSADGKLLSWKSGNTTVLSGGRALAVDLREAQREVLGRFYSQPGDESASPIDLIARTGTVQLVQSQVRQLDLTGTITSTHFLHVVDERGVFIVGFYDPQNNTDFVFDPPAKVLPSSLDSAGSWQTEGKVMDAEYTWTGRFHEAGPHNIERASFDDCIMVETALELRRGGELSKLSWGDWMCANIGVVETRNYDANGVLTTRSMLVSSDHLPAAPNAIPTYRGATEQQQRPHLSAISPTSDPATWRLTRLARLGRGMAANSATISPVWVPANPPLLLAAGDDGDLVAFYADDMPRGVVWRFHTGGHVYGRPAYDARTGRIYFGSSDKRLYALEVRGLFLWAFNAGDNVASRPLVAGDGDDSVVIFGSEDRYIYGVDAATGQERWRVLTGGSVVSSPAQVGNLAIIGSDDGKVYAIEVTTGKVAWTYLTGKAVEAPIVVSDDTIYVASRDGYIYALDSTGREIWSTKAGSILRTEPVVTQDRLYIVDYDGYLRAFDRATGRRLWASVESVYVGPAVPVGDHLLVAADRGFIYLIGPDGKRRKQWSFTDTALPDEGQPDIEMGPSAGGDALWAADSRAVLRRLSPADSADGTPASLAPRWVVQHSQAPFKAHGLSSTVVEYEGKAVALDEGSNVYLIDPTTGRGEHAGTIPVVGGVVRVEPVVAGDTLLAPIGNTLYAWQLPDGGLRWKFESTGISYRPPAVSSDSVVWLTQPRDGGDGTVHVLDLARGRLRWEAALKGIRIAGGTAVRNGKVYVSTPPAAFDLRTGRLLWQADTDTETGVGGPQLSEDGHTLYVGLMNSEQNTTKGAVAALDTDDGGVLWRAELGEGDNILSLLERPWLSGDMLVLPLVSGDIVGVDGATGKELWRYRPDVPRLGAITIADGRVWFGLENGHVLALDARTGKQVAAFSELEMNLSGVGVAQRPAIIGGVVIVPIGAGMLGLQMSEP
jgi:outer membrane protein assembly factor BamB